MMTLAQHAEHHRQMGVCQAAYDNMTPDYDDFEQTEETTCEFTAGYVYDLLTKEFPKLHISVCVHYCSAFKNITIYASEEWNDLENALGNVTFFAGVPRMIESAYDEIRRQLKAKGVN